VVLQEVWSLPAALNRLVAHQPLDQPERSSWAALSPAQPVQPWPESASMALARARRWRRVQSRARVSLMVRSQARLRVYLRPHLPV
jgi:hypothetical protein